MLEPLIFFFFLLFRFSMTKKSRKKGNLFVFTIIHPIVMAFLPLQIMWVPPIYGVCFLASSCKQKQTFTIISNKTHWQKNIDDKFKTISSHHQASPTKQNTKRKGDVPNDTSKQDMRLEQSVMMEAFWEGNIKEHQSKTSIKGVLEEAMASNEAQEVNRFVVRSTSVWGGRRLL